MIDAGVREKAEKKVLSKLLTGCSYRA